MSITKFLPVFFLVITCLSIVYWSLRPRWRIYEFPFFSAVGFISLVVPQAIALYNNPYPVSIEYVDLTIFMAIFCLIACWLGYTQTKTSLSLLAKFKIDYSNNTIFIFGIFYAIIGNIFNVMISDLPEDQLAQSQWTGIVTIYYFFSRLIYLGFALMLSATLTKPSNSRWLLVTIASFWPLFKFFFMARRTETTIFLCIILITLFLVRGYVLPLFLLIILGIVATIFVNLIGLYRAELSQLNISFKNWSEVFEFNWIGDWLAAIGRVDWWQGLQDQFFQADNSPKVDVKTSELKFAASLIEATDRSLHFGFGASYWNTLILRFIPGQLLGKGFKQMLLIPYDFARIVFDYYQIQTFKIGFTLPLMGELFSQFWFLGILVYYWLSVLMKHIWNIATISKNVVVQVFYVLIIPFSIVIVFAGLSNFLVEIIYYIAFMIIVHIFSIKKVAKQVFR